MRGVLLVALAGVWAYPSVATAGEPTAWSGQKAVRAVAGVAAVTGQEVLSATTPKGRMPASYRAYDPHRADKAVAARARKEYAPRAAAAARQAQVNRVLGQQAAGTNAAISRARSLGAPAARSVGGTYWWFVW